MQQYKYLINFYSQDVFQKKLFQKNKSKLIKIFEIVSKDFLPKKNVYELSLSFLDSIQIQNLNKQYRKKNKTTDVLSFVQGDETEKEYILGDIFINFEMLKENFKGIEMEKHFVFLFIHSILHLVGFDHKNDQQHSKMLKQEKKLISIFY